MKYALLTSVVLLLLGVLSALPLGPMAVAEEEGEQPPPARGGRAGPWERMKTWDTNGDGRISRDEFRGPDPLWQRLDADGNGEITEEEARKAASGRRRGGREGRPRAERPDGSPPGPGGLLLEHVDADGDGKVTQAEWAAFFEATDLDEDGVITPEEWKRAVSPPSRANGEAPKVGQAAPGVKAVTLDGTRVVDLAKPKRVTVLVFGSWT